MLNRLQLVIESDGPGGDAERETDDPDGRCLHPYGAADLVAQSTHGAQHAQFAPAVGNGDCERIDDAENGDQHGDDHLYVGEAEPLVHDLADVCADLTVEHHEQMPLPAHAFDNPAAHFFLGSAGLEIDAEDVHRVVLEIADVETAFEDDG